MRVRRVTVAAAVLALAVAMTGCTKSAPEITDAQVQEWRDLAAETIPSATNVAISAGQNATMTALSNYVTITVNFANFADLKSSGQAVADFDATVREQAGKADVTTSLVNGGADALEAEVVARVLERVPGIENVQASAYGVYSPSTIPPSMSLYVYVYVTDPPAIDPQWLDDVSSATQQVASDAGGQIRGIAVLPADAAELDLSGPELDSAMIPIGDLQAFKDFGVDNGCVRTDSWAYDVSNPWAIVYPANEPGGACV